MSKDFDEFVTEVRSGRPRMALVSLIEVIKDLQKKVDKCNCGESKRPSTVTKKTAVAKKTAAAKEDEPKDK